MANRRDRLRRQKYMRQPSCFARFTWSTSAFYADCLAPALSNCKCLAWFASRSPAFAAMTVMLEASGAWSERRPANRRALNGRRQ